MYYDALAEYNPLVMDIVIDYMEYRRKKYGREKALNQLHMDYSNEESDYNDGPVFRVGLAMALCQKKELTEAVRDDAVSAINTLIDRDDWKGEGNRVLDRARKTITLEKMIGPEADYRPSRKYDPNWEVGDTFAYLMQSKKAQEAGVGGWYLLIRKVSEHVDRQGQHVQIVYMTICAPDKLPTTAGQLDALGVLPVYGRHHMWSMYFTSKKDEKAYGLQKIGCYPNARLREDVTSMDPYRSLPTFKGVHGDCPVFETMAIDHYVREGINY